MRFVWCGGGEGEGRPLRRVFNSVELVGIAIISFTVVVGVCEKLESSFGPNGSATAVDVPLPFRTFLYL